jgi:prepilin-type N-terminal cleavage/methylation domain-containing protein
MQRLRKEDGFTLIETMAAMAILTIGILTYFTLQANMIRTNARASSMSTASNLVAGQLETLRQAPYSTLASSTPATQVVDAQTGYIVTWVVTPNVPVAGASRIAARVAVPNNGPVVTFDYVKFDDGT